jgi:hypothetical protein
MNKNKFIFVIQDVVAPHNMAATFTENSVTINYAALANGSVSPATQSVGAATGSPSATATADTGYKLEGWYAAADTTFTTRLSTSLTFVPPKAGGLNIAGDYVARFTQPTSGGGGGYASSANPSGSFSGSNTYTKGSGAGLVFIVDKAFSQFHNVLVGNTALTQDSDYTAVESSTKITLLPEYLDALIAGTHTVRVNFKDSTFITAKFTVADASITGDPNAGGGIPFEDVKESDWFASGVMYAYENELMTGTNKDPMLFSPNSTLTRGMVVTILGRHAGATEAASDSPFTDVKDGAYYAPYVYWAQENEIVMGYGNEKFGPNDPITRQDFAVILMRYMNYMEINLPVTMDFRTYADNDSIAVYANDAIQTLNKLKVINGVGENEAGQTAIDPKGNTTRAQAAAMLHRFMLLIE